MPRSARRRRPGRRWSTPATCATSAGCSSSGCGSCSPSDAPTFDNWDQDETAVADRYGEQDPATVAGEVTSAGASFARAYAQVPDDGWERTGIRSNGSEFTVLTLGQYGLHDLRHHLWDVGVDSP